MTSQNLVIFSRGSNIRPGQKFKNKTKLFISNLKIMYVTKILKFQRPEFTYEVPHITDIATS
jgi:hypothetical protein